MQVALFSTVLPKTSFLYEALKPLDSLESRTSKKRVADPEAAAAGGKAAKKASKALDKAHGEASGGPRGTANESRVFEVDHLIAERTRGGKTQFKVRWGGYSAEEDTWEDEANIMDTGLVDKLREPEQQASPGRKSPRNRQHADGA